MTPSKAARLAAASVLLLSSLSFLLALAANNPVYETEHADEIAGGVKAAVGDTNRNWTIIKESLIILSGKRCSECLVLMR